MISHKSFLFLALGFASAVASAATLGSQARELQARQSWLSGTQNGDATFFNTGFGACGVTSNNNEFVVAMSATIFDNYPGYNGDPVENPICGMEINVQYQGRYVQAIIVDRCPGCATDDIDLSPSAFQFLADLSLGRIPVTWEWA